MAETGKVELKEKLITMSAEVFEVLAADAIRCKRSVNKQIEAILSAYTGVESVDLNNEAVKVAQSQNGKKRAPVIDVGTETNKKKKSA